MLDAKSLNWSTPNHNQIKQTPKQLPSLGSALAFGKDPLTFLESLSGDTEITQFRLGKLKMHLIS